MLPPEMAEKLRAAIPDGTLVEIPASYHHLVLDNPTAFVRALDAFLARTLNAAGR